jgi:hypothetical protein
MPITDSEQGSITEAEFVKVAMITSNGQAVPTRPVIDDEHRDVDIHLRRHFMSLAVQCKSALRLRMQRGKRILQISFSLRPPFFSSPLFWYFFAQFDVKSMSFTEPVFLAPSSFVHRQAVRGVTVRHGRTRFVVQANLDPKSKDKWSPYRLSLAELGPKIVEILKASGAKNAELGLDPLRIEPGIILLTKRRKSSRSRLVRAA